MILQALYSLYQRLATAGKVDQPGFAPMGIRYAIVLDLQGKLVQLQNVSVPADKGNKTVPMTINAPYNGKRAAADKANFLVDKSDYVFGLNPEADAKIQKKLPNRFALFRDLVIAGTSQVQHPHYDAVAKFLQSWDRANPDAVEQLVKVGLNPEDLTSANFAFKIVGETGFIHDLPEVRSYWAKQASDSANGSSGFCLITNDESSLAQLHGPAIKGVVGAQSMGAALVSFNLPAFTSYGKSQSLNAPVSEAAAFGYCTALNYLLADRNRRFRVGDATCVFWTDAATEDEATADDLVPWLINDGNSVPEDEGLKATLRRVTDQLARGELTGADLGKATTRFFLLGLSPNAARLSVRFWMVGTLGELADHLQQHHNDLRIVRQFDDPVKFKHTDKEVPNVFDLLRQTAREADGIPPLLGGALMRAIITGTDYPDALITAVLRRIQAERDINYLKAAILKAWLVRNQDTFVPIMLDESISNIGYRLGRLFALLEKTQLDAMPGVNASIRDRYYSSASGTPRAVFGRLLRGYQHHVAKLEGGLKVSREKAVQDVLHTLTDIPSHLNLADQSQFALGYYHQRKAFYTAKEKPEAVEAQGKLAL